MTEAVLPTHGVDTRARARHASTRHRLLFPAILVLLLVGITECASWIVWKYCIDDYGHNTVAALCSNNLTQRSTYLPNAFWHHDLNPSTYVGEINSKGTRGADFSVPKPAGEFRVVCVGDSTVEGYGLPVQDSFPALLEQILASVARNAG